MKFLEAFRKLKRTNDKDINKMNFNRVFLHGKLTGILRGNVFNMKFEHTCSIEDQENSTVNLENVKNKLKNTFKENIYSNI